LKRQNKDKSLIVGRALLKTRRSFASDVRALVGKFFKYP
jgi:hypothetical protein